MGHPRRRRPATHLRYLYLLLDVERRRVHGTAVAAVVAASAPVEADAAAVAAAAADPRVVEDDLPLPQRLQLSRPVPLVHRAELVPSPAHSVVPHGCKGKEFCSVDVAYNETNNVARVSTVSRGIKVKFGQPAIAEFILQEKRRLRY